MVELDTGISVSKLSDMPAAARAVEELGFSALWTAETGHDPYLPIALAAEHTNRIKLGTSIAVAFPRSPMIHAMTAWDLAQQSGGRFILGLGTQVRGHNKRRFGVVGAGALLARVVGALVGEIFGAEVVRVLLEPLRVLPEPFSLQLKYLSLTGSAPRTQYNDF